MPVILKAYCVFPAYAGVILRFGSLQKESHCVPRVCGGDLKIDHAKDKDACVPRVCGGDPVGLLTNLVNK